MLQAVETSRAQQEENMAKLQELMDNHNQLQLHNQQLEEQLQAQTAAIQHTQVCTLRLYFFIAAQIAEITWAIRKAVGRATSAV